MADVDYADDLVLLTLSLLHSLEQQQALVSNWMQIKQSLSVLTKK